MSKPPRPFSPSAGAALSAVLLVLAFPPFDLRWLVLVALVPWLVSIRGQEARAVRRSGLVFGAIFYGYQMWWVVPFVYKWTGNLVSGLVPWVVTVPIAMGYFWLQASWMGAAERQGRAWAIPLLWVAMEFIRSYIPGLAFPWGHMATPLWPFPAVLQSAALGGIFLVSAWVVLVNQWLAEWRWPRADGAMNRWRTGAAVVIVALFGYSWWRASTPPDGNWHVVAAAQPGVDQAFTPPDEERIRLDGAGPELMADAERAGAELVVFPEGFASPSESVVPTAVLGYPPAVPVILGGNLVQGGKRYQTAYSWDGMQWKHANKTRLVVFGEYVPGRDVLPFLKNFNLPAGDLTPGDRVQSLPVGPFQAGPLLCFEGLFPDLALAQQQAGAQLLTVQAIDDWYAATPAWEQLYPGAVFRSIEAGLPVVRAGSKGRSYITDARGNIVAWLPHRDQGLLTARVRVPAGGDGWTGRMMFPWLCLAVALAVMVANVVAQCSKDDADEGSH